VVTTGSPTVVFFFLALGFAATASPLPLVAVSPDLTAAPVIWWWLGPPDLELLAGA